MTDQPSENRDLEQRVSALEGKVAQLRDQVARTATDAEAARTLASGADRDVSEVRAELRAHTRSLNALRESQLELGTNMASLNDSVDRRFSLVDSSLQQITGMLQTLIDRDGRSNGSAGR